MSKPFISNTNEQEASRLIRGLFKNIHFLDENDIEVIRFLGQKGFYNDKKAVIINK